MVKRITVVCWLGMALVWMAAAAGVPVGTGFAYQGRLQQAGGPANGLYDFRFELFEAATGSNRVGASLTNGAVPVTSGLFSVQLDFGAGAFDGSARWLEISVRADTNDFTVLQPRQPVTPTPYALQAATVAQVPATNLFGLVPDALLSSNIARLDGNPQFTGSVTALSFSGDGSGLTNLPPSTETNAVNALVAANLTNANVIYVDGLAGNDATGQRGTAKAFATLAAALSNVVNGSTVVLRPGTHHLVCADQAGVGDWTWTAPAHLFGVTNFTLNGYGATVIASNYGYGVSFANCDNVSIRGIRWIGDYESWPSGQGVAGCLGFGGLNHNVTIEDCFFESWPDQVITCLCGSARNTSGLRVVNNLFKDVGMIVAPWIIAEDPLPDGACISGTIGSDCVVRGNRTEGRIVRFFEYENAGQKDSGGCTNILVTENIVSGLLDWGILFVAPDGYVAYNVRIADNLIEYPLGSWTSGSGAIFVSGVVDGMVSGNQVFNYSCWVYSPERAAISVQAANWVVVDNNLLENCGPVGISAGAQVEWMTPSDHLTVRNNTILNPMDWGIAVGATNALVVGNTIHHLLHDYGVGIAVASSANTGTVVAGTVTNVILRNNTVSGPAGAHAIAFFECGTNFIPHFVVDNNRNETTARSYVFWTEGQTMTYSGEEAFTVTTPAQIEANRAKASAPAQALSMISTPANSVASAQPEADGNRYTVSFGSSSYTLASTNDVYFSNSTNRLAGPQVSYCILPSPVGRSLRFNPQWVFLNGTAPTSLAPGKAAVLTFRCFGDSEDRVFVTCELQP